MCVRVCVSHTAEGNRIKCFLLSLNVILQDPAPCIILNVTKKTETFKRVLRLPAIIAAIFRRIVLCLKLLCIVHVSASFTETVSWLFSAALQNICFHEQTEPDRAPAEMTPGSCV